VIKESRVKHCLRRAVAVFGAALSLVLPMGSVASASEPTTLVYGWWSNGAVAGGPDGAVAPDAPSDGMVVQGGEAPIGEFAYAGLQFTYDSAALPGLLHLTLAGTAPPTGTAVQACRMVGNVTPAEGGPASQGPSYDCTGSRAGTVVTGGMDFDVAAFATPGEVKVALVAGGPSDRVVFNKPTAASLALRLSAPTADGRSVIDSVTPASDNPSAAAAADLQVSPSSATVALPAIGVISTPSSPTVAESLPSPNQAAPDQTAGISAGAPSAVSGHRKNWTALLAMALSLLVVTTWSAAGRMAGAARTASDALLS
jgi:hypothetical protein